MILRYSIPLRPTGGGAIWLLAILALLATAINYGNNMVFALAFLLFAIWLQSAWECHRNLAGLSWRWLPVPPVFAGDAMQLCGLLENSASRSRPALALSRLGQSGLAWDAPASGEVRLDFSCRAEKRGKTTLDGFSLATRHPLALWQARRRLPPLAALVYPAPSGDEPLPTGAPQKAHRHHEADDFQGVRAYLPGDRPNRINWRAYGRREELLVNQFDGGSGGQTLWLDWSLCHGDAEQRLSQLAGWVIEADRQALEYGIHLGEQPIPPARGHVQRETCLTRLALHQTTHSLSGAES